MRSASPAPSAFRSLWPLAIFRMLFGIMYLQMGLSKAPWIITDGHRYGWLYGWIEKEIQHPTFGWYKAFLQAVVLRNFDFFGALSFVTEIALGVALILGLFIPLVGLGGALWQVNIALGSYSVPGEWPWIWMLLIMPQIAFALCRAGRALGADAVLARMLADRFAAGKALPWWTRYLV